MFIQCEKVLPPVGAELILEISSPQHEVIRLPSVVSWQREAASEEGPRGVGVKFDVVPEQLGLIVDELVLGYSGITVLVQCVDAHDRKSIVRMLKAIIATAEVVFADDETIVSTLVGPDTDLLIVDVDEGEPGALIALELAKEAGIPTIAFSQEPREILIGKADRVLCNPPANLNLRKAVLDLLASPSWIVEPITVPIP